MKQDKNGLGRATQSLRLARLAETARWVRCTGAFGAGLLLALTASAAQPPARGGTGAAKAVGCLIEPDRVADVGSQVIGVVDQIYVDRGDMVKAGQRLLALRADIERANASVAEKRSRVDADVLAAKAGLALAEQKVHRAEMLVTQKFVSDQAVDQARGEAEVARQKVNQVSSQQQIWVQERNVAEAQLEIRTVRSPFAGVVVERYVNQGERVEDRPMIRVAVIDPLRVELLVPTAQYGRLVVGEQVTIQPELPGAGAVKGTVRHVDRVLDAASNSFRVRLSVPNPDHRLPAGLRCKADIPGAELAPASPGKAATPASGPRLAPVVGRQQTSVRAPTAL